MSDPNTPGAAVARRRQPRCPICGKPTEQAFRPFCSRRCKDVDLGRWLGGEYRVGGQSAYDDEGGPPEEDGG